MTSRSRKEAPEPESVADVTEVTQQSTQDAAQIIDELEFKLLERDELVEALTQRLEQAAEQLDRIKRTGTDRITNNTAPAAIPPELLNQQQSLMEELQQTCQQWQDLQLGSSMGRFELQLNEIRDLVTGLYQSERPLIADLTMAERRQGSASVENTDSRIQNDSTTEEATPSDWEALKASFMEEEPAAPQEAATHAEPDTTHETPANSETYCEFQELKLNDPPAEIDPNQTNHEELISAVKERDEYVSYLLKYIHNTHMKNWQVPVWENLQDAPEELCWNLQQLEKQLKDTLRLAEVQHSMERARLGREEACLRQAEHDLKAKMKQAGMELADMDSEASLGTHADTKKSKRWLKFIGK